MRILTTIEIATDDGDVIERMEFDMSADSIEPEAIARHRERLEASIESVFEPIASGLQYSL